jgi:hypothetical protein
MRAAAIAARLAAIDSPKAAVPSESPVLNHW